jgi:hypothetical protein
MNNDPGGQPATFRNELLFFFQLLMCYFANLCHFLGGSGRHLGSRPSEDQHGPRSGLLGQRMSACSCLPPVVLHWPEVISRFLRRQNLQAEAGIVEVTWIMHRETHENP